MAVEPKSEVQEHAEPLLNQDLQQGCPEPCDSGLGHWSAGGGVAPKPREYKYGCYLRAGHIAVSYSPESPLLQLLLVTLVT